jgi:hypothetical protein
MEIEYLSEKQFSLQYLGKCDTYFAYLKCSGKQPIADALLNLWGKLNLEKQIFERSLKQARTPFHKQMLNDWIVLYSSLGEKTFNSAIVPLSLN